MSRKRCRHQVITLQEIGESYTDHVRDRDGTWSHHSAVGDYTGKIYAMCQDCGKLMSFTAKNRPAWLKQCFQEMKEAR